KVEVDGREVPFDVWFEDIAGRKAEIDASKGQSADKLSDVEKNAYDAGERLYRYRVIREGAARANATNLFVPRPDNRAYMAFTGDVYKKLEKAVRAGESERAAVAKLSAMELDAWRTLAKYYHELQQEDRKVPGNDADFDAQFAGWLRETSDWVPLPV